MAPSCIALFLFGVVIWQVYVQRTINCYDSYNKMHPNFNYNYEQKINIEKSSNTKVDPCEDFYEYACGSYRYEHTDPNYDELTQYLDLQFNNKFLKYLNSLNRWSMWKEYSYVQKMSNYFEACSRKQKRNLNKYFDEIKPAADLNWPLLEGNNFNHEPWLRPGNDFNFWSLLGQLHSYGLNDVILNYQITRNESGYLDVQLGPAGFEEHKSLPETNTLQILLTALGIENIHTIVEQLNSTDQQWLQLLDNIEYVGEVKATTLENLSRKYPNLNLRLYVENLIGAELSNIATITIDTAEFFDYLNELSWPSKEVEEWCNYLMIKFLFYLAEDSTAEFTALECVKDLRNKFNLAVNFEYYRHHFKSEETRFGQAIFNMLQMLRTIMAEYFDENNMQLSPLQTRYLKSKLWATKVNIGNLPEDLYPSAIDDYYGEVPNLDNQNYYKNHLLLLQHCFRKSLVNAQNQSHYVVNDNQLGSSSSAFYVAKQNLIVIPLGYLQFPMFHYSFSPLYRLSLLGFVLAHEMAHAFDTTSLNFDDRGVYRPNNSDIIEHENFSKSVECMQQQHPTQEIDERIADLFGLRVVFRAYLKYFYSAGDPSEWPRYFFLNLAQYFCGKGDLQFVDHDPDAVRLRQILKNFPEFSEAFQCREGSPMNPKEKCRLY